MRKALTMLGAIAALALGSFVSPALAGSPPAPVGLGCTLVNDLPAVYPRNGYYYYCGTNSATFRNPSASSWAGGPSVIDTKLKNSSSYLFVFDTKAEAETYLGFTLPSNVFGFTGASSPGDPGHPWIMSMTWESNGWSRVSETLTHEMGHALDFAYGEPSNNLSSTFHSKVNLDWTYINSLTRAQMFPRGVPTQKVNKPGGTWTSYSPGTKNNQQILQDLFPWIFNTGDPDANSELFAHTFQQYNNNWLNDCPYANVGGTLYLKWPEVFSKFQNVTKTTTGGYFRTMYLDNANYTP